VLQRVQRALEAARHQQVNVARLDDHRIGLHDLRRHFPHADEPPQQVTIVDSKGLVRYAAPGWLHRPNDGRMMLDVTIQFHPDRYSYTNVRPDWHLPRRLDVAKLFFRDMASRVQWQGLPTTAVSANESSTWLHIPGDHGLIWACRERHHQSEYPVVTTFQPRC
jgi:hypothetical protein